MSDWGNYRKRKSCADCRRPISNAATRCYYCFAKNNGAKKVGIPTGRKCSTEARERIAASERLTKTGTAEPCVARCIRCGDVIGVFRNRSKATKYCQGCRRLATAESISRAKMGHTTSESTRQKIARTISERPRRETQPEKTVKEWLQKMDIPFQPQAPIGPFLVDFLLPKHRVVIEVFGDYWHANPRYRMNKSLHPGQIGATKRDNARVSYLTKAGYWVLILWEMDINENHHHCRKRIRTVLMLREAEKTESKLFV